MQSKTVPTVPGGWAEAIWDEPIPFISDGEPVFVMYEFPGGDARKYVYSNDFKQDDGLFRPADDGSRLAMTGFRDVATSGHEVFGMAFQSPDTAQMISSVRGSASYGVDIIIDEGPEPSGPGISWTDGTTESAASLLGWWDGSDIQPAVLKGWWDGTAIQDLT